MRLHLVIFLRIAHIADALRIGACIQLCLDFCRNSVHDRIRRIVREFVQHKIRCHDCALVYVQTIAADHHKDSVQCHKRERDRAHDNQPSFPVTTEIPQRHSPPRSVYTPPARLACGGFDAALSALRNAQRLDWRKPRHHPTRLYTGQINRHQRKHRGSDKNKQTGTDDCLLRMPYAVQICRQRRTYQNAAAISCGKSNRYPCKTQAKRLHTHNPRKLSPCRADIL